MLSRRMRGTLFIALLSLLADAFDVDSSNQDKAMTHTVDVKMIKRMYQGEASASSIISEKPYIVNTQKYKEKFYRDLKAKKKVKAQKNKESIKHYEMKIYLR